MASSSPAVRMTPKPPEGWPVGSFPTYEKAQAAIEKISKVEDFPVDELTIVGVNLMQVERVVGRLSWGKVVGGGIAYGLALGVFFGLLLGLFQEDWVSPLIVGAGMGMVFGMVSAGVPYAMSKSQRDFASTTQIVAGRYDVLCKPSNAAKARDVLAGGQ